MTLFVLIFMWMAQVMLRADTFQLKTVKKSCLMPIYGRSLVARKSSMQPLHLFKKPDGTVQAGDKGPSEKIGEETKQSVLEQVASKGLAGVLAIALAEAIFWAAGMPLATLWVKFTTGEWLDLSTAEGQMQAAGFTFGYGGFATVILQYRVTLFAIPLVPVMEKFVVAPARTLFGENFGSSKKD